MRAVISGVLALLAAVGASAAVLLALTASVVADPERPGRLGAVALASPLAREQATDYLVGALRDEGLSGAASRPQVEAAVDRALADPEVREALGAAEVSADGGVRLDGVYDAVAARLEEQGREREAERVRALPAEPTATRGLASELTDAARTARMVLVLASAGIGLAALLVAGLALAAARRTLLCLGGIVLATGLLLGVVLLLMPALAGAEGAAGTGWLATARGLDDVLGGTGTVTVAAVTAVGAVLTLLGLTTRRR